MVVSGEAIGRNGGLSGRAGCGLNRAHDKNTLRKKKNAAQGSIQRNPIDEATFQGTSDCSCQRLVKPANKAWKPGGIGVNNSRGKHSPKP